MRIVTIGDLHGLDVWKKADGDLNIFLGDYVDSFHVPGEKMVKNLSNIIERKLKDPDKNILLLGNHDIQYILPNEFGVHCSGRRRDLEYMYRHLFEPNLNLFKVCHQIGNHLWLHGGLTNFTWDNYYFPKIDLLLDNMCLGSAMNVLWEKRDQSLFHIGYNRGGSSEQGGIFWMDQSDLREDPLDLFHQIVGHNKVPEIESINDGAVVFVDSLWNGDKFFEMEID